MQLEADAVFGVQPKPKEADPIPPAPVIKDRYTVQITANPTSVNKDAKITPHVTTLELSCGADTSRLVNLNYPIRKKMSWEPENCDAVSVQIEIGSLILVKKYEGKLAFAHFAKDFQSGSHRYTPADFPTRKKQVSRLRIKTIKVGFKVRGGQALVDILDQQAAREKALAALEEKRKVQAADSNGGIKELLATWERKQKMSALENEAVKKAWKEKQEERARKIKERWEQNLPDVPVDISTCWDK
jgi:type VI secretion system protein ImpL